MRLESYSITVFSISIETLNLLTCYFQIVLERRAGHTIYHSPRVELSNRRTLASRKLGERAYWAIFRN